MAQKKYCFPTLVIIFLFAILYSFFLFDHLPEDVDLISMTNNFQQSQDEDERLEVKGQGTEVSKVAPMGNQTTPDVLRLIPEEYYDEERYIRDLWPFDKQCQKFDVLFGKNLPFVYLLSFPRSGNTWVRYLVEAATGIFTGSIYTSEFLFRIGFFGEAEDPWRGTVIMVKSHRDKNFENEILLPPLFNSSLPVVAIIRNPERAVISFINYVETRGSFARSLNFFYNETEAYYSYVMKRLQTWLNIYSNCLKYTPNLLIIFYENLVKNPLNEIKKIVNFLGYKIDPKRLECLKRHLQGPVKREHIKEELKIFHSEEVRKEYISSVKQILSLLDQRGIEAPKEYRDYINT